MTALTDNSHAAGESQASQGRMKVATVCSGPEGESADVGVAAANPPGVVAMANDLGPFAQRYDLALKASAATPLWRGYGLSATVRDAIGICAPYSH